MTGPPPGPAANGVITTYVTVAMGGSGSKW